MGVWCAGEEPIIIIIIIIIYYYVYYYTYSFSIAPRIPPGRVEGFIGSRRRLEEGPTEGQIKQFL